MSAPSAVAAPFTGGGRERGSGSVLTLALVVAIVVLGMALVSAGARTLARVDAQNAADLAALAGAHAARGHAAQGDESREAACEAASAAARANRATVVRCAAAGATLTVLVRGGRGAEASAVAGPAWARAP
ncbi:Rv3654c family TadE-like protein [Demequina sp. NBRC 110053]|uniref:Rv3654c family TadE-like protein n=1 Tax=Demequina sp. NBRC 110053 TaxID=1570342 RepID=UPI001F3562AF|nr:Rv3654c family TadE-like protein [Demequina sp. NBRC 110053]